MSSFLIFLIHKALKTLLTLTQPVESMKINKHMHTEKRQLFRFLFTVTAQTTQTSSTEKQKKR